ncbi:MAG TPA: ABC transporter ATP-binding protein [Chloroflexota bacterium]|jgi:ABC-2 type transport system ATP-binding protein|nr:ABC transporter ATP-binding protein [Chloroflexota bacterium]
MISVEDLNKYYGPRRAVSDVSFSVEKGEILGFLGPNGAGKTTTMRILTGFLPASSGTATIAGFDVFKQPIEARRHLGYLPENVPLYPEMSIGAYLDFMAKIKAIPGGVRKARVDEAMELTAVTDRRDQLIGKLSKGYRQRVGLAQAVLGKPPVLILDEPTVGLDPRQIIEVRNLIKSLGGEHTVILSTHILPEVGMTCSRVVIISDGRLVAVDTPENLAHRLRGSENIRLEVRGPKDDIVKRLRALPRVIGAESEALGDGRAAVTVACDANTDLREELAKSIVEGGWGLLEMRPVGMSLEEVFLQLTTSEEPVTA